MSTPPKDSESVTQKWKRPKSESPKYELALNSLLRRPPGAGPVKLQPRSGAAESRFSGRGNCKQVQRGQENCEETDCLQNEIISTSVKKPGGESSNAEASKNRSLSTESRRASTVKAQARGKDHSLTRTVQLTAHDSVDGGALFLLLAPENEFLVLFGTGEVRVLHGSISILASTIDNKSPPARLFSNAFSPFMLTVVPGGKTKAIAIDVTQDPFIDADVQEAIARELASLESHRRLACAVVRFAPLCTFEDHSIALSAVVTQIPCPFAGLDSGGLGVGNSDSAVKLVEGLFRPVRETRATPFQLWKQWSDVCIALSPSKGDDENENRRILVCGDAGTGKSMAARCIVNYLLNSCRSVLFLETDVGQSEMMPPGFVAVHEVSAALLGPSSSHNQFIPIYSSYFGEITPRENVRQYALAVSLVVNNALEYASSHGLPLVCNSDGWVSGIGGQLLEHVHACLSPTHIISTSFKEGITGSGEHSSKATPEALVGAIKSVCERRHVTLSSPHSMRNTLFPGSLLREYGLCAYFVSCVESGNVYTVSLEDINVAIVGEGVSRSHLLGALNGSIVAVGMTDGQSEAIRWNCRGLAVVRGVDKENLTLYVSTPIPEEELENCDGLVMSAGIQLPGKFILATAGMTEGPDCRMKSQCAPYVVGDVLGNSDAMRSRSNLHRR